MAWRFGGLVGVGPGWSRLLLKITIWGGGGVLPPLCDAAPVGRG